MRKIVFMCILCGSLFSFAGKEDEMNVVGEKIDREGIRNTFIKKEKELFECYNTALILAKDSAKKAGKDLGDFSGKMVFDFSIDEDGSVIYIQLAKDKSKFQSERVAGCISKLVYSWKFPQPPKGQTVQVFYPMSFSGR